MGQIDGTEPRYPTNTVSPRDGDFDSQLKLMKDTTTNQNFVFYGRNCDVLIK